MLIYKDFVSGDELCSDSYPMELKFNGAIMEVTGANIREDGGIDESLIGGNASAEGGDEGGADDAAVTGINVIMNGKLNPTQFGKKDFKVYMGSWFKKAAKWVEENKGEEAAASFKKDGMAAFKEIFSNFKDWELYVGENMDPDGSLVFMNYKEDGVTPYFWFFAHALEEEKF
jgi:hypothetical protein